MNQDVLEMCRKRLAALAEQMEVETVACSAATIQLEGEEREVPTVVVKGGEETVLRRPLVRCQVLGIETSECPVVGVGVEFPEQVETLTAWYWSWIPMHTADQRKLLKLIASAPVWLVVIFSGERVNRALIVRVNDIARAQYRQLEKVVERYPTNRRADTKRAIDGAQAATAAALGDGHTLETVKDIGVE